MQFVQTKQDEQRRSAAAVSRKGTKLSMYGTPPEEEVTLEEFEGVAIDRLRVLKGIEDAMSRGRKPAEMEPLINELLIKHRLEARCSAYAARNRSYAVAWPDDDRVRRDMVSHFVLRLAYCRTEELRRWLVTQEAVLFRHRFNRLIGEDKVAFMSENALYNKALSADEFSEVKNALLTVLQSYNTKENAINLINNGATAFYSVPFELVPELVRSRRVYLRRGRAYVHRDSLASLVVGAFKTQLSSALSVTARKWSTQFAGEEAERVAPVVDALSTRYLGAEYGRGGDGGAGVSLAELDAAAGASFPLCMRNLYGHLKDAHHLRHAGRMQLGLFLKGIGLQLDEAMAFWRTEFCKKIPGEQFEKQYAYAIRHNYGREGKRADYTPYSCMKVITSTPGTGEHHGCPYRTFSEDNLRAALRSMRLAPPAVAEVLDKVRGKHYQLACGSAFAGVHGCECEAGVQHPNQYFTESRKALGLDKPKDAGAAPGSPASPGGGPTLSTPAPGVKTSQAGTSPPARA